MPSMRMKEKAAPMIALFTRFDLILPLSSFTSGLPSCRILRLIRLPQVCKRWPDQVKVFILWIGSGDVFRLPVSNGTEKLIGPALFRADWRAA
jgi:hypothetical protein